MKQPSIFVSHGAPTLALEPGLAGQQLSAVGRALGKPRAIVVISPHWTTSGVQVASGAAPRTVHDFGGFAKALYQLTYPAPGAPELAARIVGLLDSAGSSASLNERQGRDHGAWVPLMHMYPDADVPVVQVSMPGELNAAGALALGRALAPLSEEGVLVIGSGSLTHNLYEFRSGGGTPEAQYACEFASWIRAAVCEGDEQRLLAALDQAPHARRAHPTEEHFLPLLVAAGAAPARLPVTVLDGGIRHGVLAMESYVFGQALDLGAGTQSSDANEVLSNHWEE